jgi:hypothetical protein
MTVSISMFAGIGAQFFTDTGEPLAGGLIYTYQAGTTTPAAEYTTSAGNIAHSNPIVLDSAGRVPNEIWLTDAATYKFVLQTAAAVLVGTYDNVYGSASASDLIDIYANLANTNDVAKGDALIGFRQSTSAGAYANAVGRTVHQKLQQFVSFLDFGATPDGTVNDSVFIQNAIDSGAAAFDMTGGIWRLGEPLLIKNSTPRVTLFSNNRIRTEIVANAIDIKKAPQNINTLFFNQENNPHFCLNNVYFSNPGFGYTGSIIYSKEGGGADGSGQCLFSGIFTDLWISPPSTNSGFLIGGIQNCLFDTITCENMKGVFNLQGVGVGDVFFNNFSIYSCFDSFIYQATDTFGGNYLTVNNIQAYFHLRGRLFDVQNWRNCRISNVMLAPADVNFGDLGLFKFKDCSNIVVENFQASVYTDGVADVPCQVGIEVDTTKAKFSSGYVYADIGLKISGTGEIDIEIENVDFSHCGIAISFSGAASGTLRTRNCKFNNIVSTTVNVAVANTVTWISEGDEFINAGTGGVPGDRYFGGGTNGYWCLTNARIGKEDAGAAAGWIFDTTGTGTIKLVNPTFVGVPTFGVAVGAQPLIVEQLNGRQSPTYGPIVGLDTAIANEFYVNATNGTAFTIDNPNFAESGMVITVTIANTSGGALGTVTWAGDFKLASWTSPADGNNRSITFSYDGTNWIEINRTTADVPN